MTIRNNINDFLTPEIFAKEGAVALRHELIMKNIVSTSLSKEFGQVGDTINVKDFSTFKIRRDNHVFGKDADNNDVVNKINETSIPVKIEWQDGIDTSYSFKEVQLDMTLSDFHNNVIKPQAATISEYIDRTILEKIQASDSNVATVSSYINNPDIYNDKLRTIPKINATRGVATKIGLPSTGCSFLFSSDANTILSNELVGLNTTQYPAKILEKGYITTISGGTHIYESPSILKDYKVFRAKETSVSLANNDATKYVINIFKSKNNGASIDVVGDKTLLTIKLEKTKKPTAKTAGSPTDDETKEINAYEEQEGKADNYLEKKVYLEGLTFGHLFYEEKDTGVALQGLLKKSGSEYSLEFDLTRTKRRTQNRIGNGASKEWADKNRSYEAYLEGEHLTKNKVTEIINKKDNFEIYPISNPLIVSRNVGYYIHKEAVKLVIAPPAPLDEKSKLMNTGDFTFRVTQWTDYAYDKVNVKMDIMWGVKVIRPELIIKIIM